MDPQAVLVAFDKARVETEFDRDLREKMEGGRVVWRSKGGCLACLVIFCCGVFIVGAEGFVHILLVMVGVFGVITSFYTDLR